MRRIKTVSVILAAAFLLGGCAQWEQDAITVDIGMGIYDPLELDSVSNNLTEWESTHPDIHVEESSRIRNEDFYSLGQMGAEHLPDVFITDCQTGRVLAEAGLVTDLTGETEDIGTFTYDGDVYAFPVFGEAVSVIVYDPQAWTEGDPVGYNSQDRFTVVNCYLSAVMGDEDGQIWLSHMAAGDREASFTDSIFVNRLEQTRQMMSDDHPYGSEQELIDAYINGGCPAVTLYGGAVIRLLEQLKTSRPELYDRTEFTVMAEGCIPVDYGWGVFVRAGMNEDKTDECIELAGSLVSPGVLASDPTAERLELLTDGSRPSHLMSSYFIPWFWNYAADECFLQLPGGDRTSEEYASILQNYYEMYYI